MGSIVHFIRPGREPLDHLQGPSFGDALTRGEFSFTSFDGVLGRFKDSCWHEEHATPRAIEEELDETLIQCKFTSKPVVMDITTYERTIDECGDFIEEIKNFESVASSRRSLGIRIVQQRIQKVKIAS